MTATRVLIVEDEQIIAKDLAHTLAFMGYATAGFASTGEEAVRAARSLAPDVALMDILLEGSMDGVDAARILRDECDIPVIFLTACANEGLLERVKPTEPFGYLVKPFEDRELRSTIEIALYAKRLEREKRENARWLEAALAVVSEAVAVADGQGRVRLLNAAAERLLGLPQAQVLGRPAMAALGLAAGAEAGEAAGAGGLAGLSAPGRLRGRTADGAELTAEIRLVGPAGEGGAEGAGCVLILRPAAPPAPASAHAAADLAALRSLVDRLETLDRTLDPAGLTEEGNRLRAVLAEALARVERLAGLRSQSLAGRFAIPPARGDDEH